ncbi:MAG TPA: MmoB/DmpM family protein [Acidimicrobiia bacterium]|nr:MmoB/DmpM family protein [Acidimicrobiia bacterium]
MTGGRGSEDGVGPVLQPTPLARAVVATMEDENDGLVVHDEGAYLRVLGPRVCRVSRSGVEARTGVPVRFPGDLEVIMSSFAGLMAMNEDGAVWWLASEPRPEGP